MEHRVTHWIWFENAWQWYHDSPECIVVVRLRGGGDAKLSLMDDQKRYEIYRLTNGPCIGCGKMEVDP